MDKDDAMDALRQLNGVRDVRAGGTSRVEAVDFRLFDLDRRTDTCNFVYRRNGVVFVDALLRLPKLPKNTYTPQEAEQKIRRSIPAPFCEFATVRLTPEIDPGHQDTHHYPHVTIDTTARDAIEVTKHIAQNYTPE